MHKGVIHFIFYESLHQALLHIEDINFSLMYSPGVFLIASKILFAFFFKYISDLWLSSPLYPGIDLQCCCVNVCHKNQYILSIYKLFLKIDVTSYNRIHIINKRKKKNI